MAEHQKSNFLVEPTDPLRVLPGSSIADLLNRMQKISFQGRNLGNAFRTWKQMFSEPSMIMMGMAGAMSAGGMRRLVAYLIENRFIDCLVTTGANLFHDFHESLGRHHFLSDPGVDDVALQRCLIDRVYDTLVDEDQFREEDEMIGAFSSTLDQARPYSSREFLYLLGEHLCANAKEDGILTTAYKSGVPLYCPALADSAIGIGLAQQRYLHKDTFQLDVVADVVETSRIAAESPSTSVVYFGGGTPKNFVQQAEVTAIMIDANMSGHKYAFQVITDAPHWGGLSGCTFEEAQSWGKIAHDAQKVTVHCDSTIAMPLLVTAMAQTFTKESRDGRRPAFGMGRDLNISW